MEAPYFDATGNGAVMTGRLYVTPSGRLLFAEDYLVRTLRQRFGAQSDQMLDLDRCRVTIERIQDGDVDERAEA
jgi:hypothetical protein